MNPRACFRCLSTLKAAELLIPFLALFLAGPLVAGAQPPDSRTIVIADRDEARDPGSEAVKPLEEILPDSKWLMYDRRDRVLEFCDGGTFALADWTRQGIAAIWKVTGPNQVTVTVTSEKFKGLTAVFNFDEERTSFTGHDLDKDRVVTRSPRVPKQEHRDLVISAGEQNPPAPERIVPLTKEQLISKVPQFYSFDYQADPQPGKRYWLRVNNKTWIERYPDGLQSKFKVLGHTKVQDTEGTIVVKVAGDPDRTGTDNDGGLQAFIPDKGSAVMHHWYRNIDRGDTGWSDLGPMLDVE
jgi:hypothetical protein